VRRLFIPAALALSLPIVPASLDGESIIDEWTSVFHTINLTHFADWPGVGGRMPIDISSAVDKIWLIWPHAIISLNSRGMPDSESLLSLFSSQSTGWTPENGVLSSKGDWVAYSDKRFYRLDLLTARIRNFDWKRSPAGPIFAAPEGNLVALIGEKTYYVDFSSNENTSASLLDFNFPSALTVSTTITEFAWLDTRGIHLVSIENGKEVIIPLTAGALPAGNPWGIVRFDGKLVLAYPRALYAVELPTEESPRISKLEAEWLPRRWYRLRGSETALLIHTPETEELRIYRAEKETGAALLPSYKDFLAEHAVPAGRLLEEKKEIEAAVQYYNWALPQIRGFRSKYPLEGVWAELERELVERRLALLQVD